MSSLNSAHTWSNAFLLCLSFLRTALCQTGYEYVLNTEYAGENFFDGWNFFTGGDPTTGFVVYVDQPTAAEFSMINTTVNGPAYIGVDYTNTYVSSGYPNSGRPSVRISTEKVWTHGLFIGDFAHAPGGICGTWPAFWTLGPNWPYTGEIDIMEGVNLLTQNAMSLHTSVNFTITADATTQTGSLGGTNCAFYPPDGNGVGCGVIDQRTTSYGSGFNAIGGGVYAMQWTSDFIKVWFFPRSAIPADITNKVPNPSSWGLPAADLVGPGDNIDLHFIDHAIVFDNTFCGSYAGVVWDNVEGTQSCANFTGYSTCTDYVANVPSAFQNSYWEINSVQVYQLQENGAPPANATAALLSPIYPTTTSATLVVPIATPSQALCPTYNFTEVSYGGHVYEIDCGYTFNGDDLGLFPNYPATQSFTDCIGMCNAWTANGSVCLGVAYVIGNTACYPKNSNQGASVNTGQYAARLIYAGYGDITDTPAQIAAASSANVATAAFVSPASGVITPVHYVNPTVSIVSNTLISATAGTSLAGGGMGGPTNTTTFSLPPTTSITSTSSSLFSPTSSGHSSSTVVSSSTTTVTSSPSTQLSSTTSSTSPMSTPSLSLSTTPFSTTVSGSVQVSASASAYVSLGPGIMGIPPTTSSSATTSLPISSTSTSVGMPPPVSTSSTVMTSFSTTASTPQDGDATNYVGFSTAPTPTPSPPPATEYEFQYVGCVGYPVGSGSFDIVETDTIMSIQQCLSDCYGDAFAGISGESCYCSNSKIATAGFTTYPESDCNTPCPGEGTETCGGMLAGTSRRRQAMVLLTLYNSTADFAVTSSSSSTTSTTKSSSISSTTTSASPPTTTSSTSSSLPIRTTSVLPVSGTTSSSSSIIYSTIGSTMTTSISLPGGGMTTMLSTTTMSTTVIIVGLSTITTQPGLPITSTSAFETVTAEGIKIAIGNDGAIVAGTTYVIGPGATPVTVEVDAELFSFGPSGVGLASTTIAPYTAPTVVSASSTAMSTSSSNATANAGGFGIGSLGTGTAASVSIGATISHFESSSVSANVLPASLAGVSQSIPVVISTTYIDVCSICEGGVTTMTTTITTLHCGCTDTPMPTIPMTTMTKACGCGEGGAASSLIVTSPDTSAIASAAGSMPTITAPVLPTEPVASSGNGPAVAAAPGVGSVSGPLYSNGTAFTNGTAGIVAVASGAASGASAPAAGSGVGATLAQALNVPSMTNFVAASGAGIGGLTTVNASMTSVETVGLESIMPANGNVRSVVANIGTVLFVVIVALCIDITVVA